MADEITFFAETNYRGKNVRFGIKRDDRRRHMYLIGKTGMGKTTMLEHMVYSDIVNGNGLALVDPHGDFAEKILNYIPSSRINDVIYFNPADTDWPIAFNVMEAIDPKFMPLVASGLIGVFKKIWADTWGPRLEYVLRNSILALLEYPGSTLLGVPRILIDKPYRQKIVKKITDPVVKSFWVDEFSRYPDKFQTEAISPIQNKIGQFLSSSMVRNIISQTKSSIDLREVMDNKKILIINLAKGKIGEDYSALIGAMMITKLQLAAMGRVDISEAEREDFYLYVDEFQNFATESFANILSEARKYRLNLIIAHQYIGQLVAGQNTVVRDAVFGNVGTIATFRIGAADAEFLEKEFEPTFMMNDLVNLPKYNVYIKLMIDGVTSEAFSARTLPPLGAETLEGNADKIIKNSRQRYATPRHIIEEKIMRWSESVSSGAIGGKEASGNGNNKAKKITPGTLKGDLEELNRFKKSPPARDFAERKNSENSAAAPIAQAEKDLSKSKIASCTVHNDERVWHGAVCQKCAREISVPFKPDPARKTYCRECLRAVRMCPEKQFAGESGKGFAKKIPEAKQEEIKAGKIKQSELKPEKFISMAEAVKAKPISFYAKEKIEALPDLSGVKIIPKKNNHLENKDEAKDSESCARADKGDLSKEKGDDRGEKAIKNDSTRLDNTHHQSLTIKGKLKPLEKARFE